MQFVTFATAFLASAALAQEKTIFDIVAGSPVHKTLAGLVVPLQPIVDVLKSKEPLTLFAPTDDAFKKLNETDPKTFAARLVLADGAFDPAKAAPLQFVTTAAKATLGVRVKDGVTLEFGLGTSKVTSSAPASNGVVHIVDTVLTPPKKTSETATAAGLTELVKYLSKVSLVDAVDNTEKTTIFAPNNEAFNTLVKFAADNKLDLTDALLKSTLTLHVIPGVVYSTDIPKVTAPVKALSGDLVTIKIENGSVLVSGEGNSKPAKVIKADVLHSKGVIHVIDTVLLQKLGAPKPSVTTSAPTVSTTAAVVSATPTYAVASSAFKASFAAAMIPAIVCLL
ncbi:hypothetical protein HDV02_004668 [Globomyces sp. JEL0801]|nr:hypothetical protein HDV02_004668 [Globomyces sp. JEL0801]